MYYIFEQKQKSTYANVKKSNNRCPIDNKDIYFNDRYVKRSTKQPLSVY